MPRLRDLKDRLKKYRTMEDHILTGGQKYTIGQTPHEMPTLSVVQREIRRLEKRINRVQGRQRTVSNIDMSQPGGQA